jgi:hypothetical protein
MEVYDNDLKMIVEIEKKFVLGSSQTNLHTDIYIFFQISTISKGFSKCLLLIS